MTTEIAKTCAKCAPDRLVVRPTKPAAMIFSAAQTGRPARTPSRCRSTFRCDGRERLGCLGLETDHECR